VVDFWALFLVLSLGDIPAPDLIQRVYASRDDRTAKLSSILAGISYYAAGVVSILVGVMMRYLEPGLPDPNLAYPAMITTFLPTGLAGLTLAGLMAAVMSNADSMLLAPSIVLVRNVVGEALRRELSEAELLRGSRYAVIALGGPSHSCSLSQGRRALLADPSLRRALREPLRASNPRPLLG